MVAVVTITGVHLILPLHFAQFTVFGIMLQEYSSKQLQSLVVVGVGSRINKKSRQRLLTIADETDRKK